MKKQIKVILAILVALLGMILMISHLFEKEETIDTINNSTNSVIKEFIDLSSTTTTTTTTTTKKVVKTTKKITKAATFKNVATASKQEYMNYAKSFSGYNDTQMKCLDYLWSNESGWNPNNYNSTSDACGIPQSKPCNKIYKQQGSYDWQAQIRWGINYISNRYGGKPCNAWNHFKNHKPHWY